MTPAERYRAASAYAQERRAILVDSAKAARDRIRPARLRQDAVDKVTGTALDGVAYVAAKGASRPVAFGAAAGALGLYLARRPLAALFRRLYVRITNRDTAVSEIEDG